MVPHLVTALTGPLNELEQRMLDSMPAIERWFRLEWMEHTPPFYSAADVHNAGFKLAALETSLFPDGWNHLSEAMLPLAVQAAMAAIEKICPEARNLLLVPESRSTDPAYLASLTQLQRIFHMAGLNVRLGSIDPAIKKPLTVPLPDGGEATLEPVLRSKRRLGIKDFDPCTILLNHPLDSGVPGILEELHEQYLLPPLQAGWSMRRRSTHLKCYEEVAKRLGKLLGIDPWLIYPFAEAVRDATGATSLQTLQAGIDGVLARIRRKYKEYGIKDKPCVLLRPDCGSAGQAACVLRDARDLQDLPAHEHAAAGWLVQEGVRTQERLNQAVAEPVVYMMDRYVVGGFYRVHARQSPDEDLVFAPGSYVPLAFAQGTHLPPVGARAGAGAPNRFYMYGVVARLAMLAASYELEATDPEAESYD